MAIELIPHDPRWSDAFANEAAALRGALGDAVVAVHHIGSTAIPGILAKPVIDILCETSSLALIDEANEKMRAIGYEPKGENDIAGRRYFRKSDACGTRSHHVHVFQTGSHHVERHLAFRDFLIAHPAKASFYSDVKTAIVNGAALSRQAYQDAKAPVVSALQAEALDWRRRRRDR